MWERPTELLSTCKTCHCVARTSDTIFTAGYFFINHHFLWLSRYYRMQLKNVRAFFDLQPWGIFILYIYSHTVSNLRQGAGQLLSNFRQHGKSFRWPCRVFTEGDVGRGRGGVFCGCSCLKTAFFLFPFYSYFSSAHLWIEAVTNWVDVKPGVVLGLWDPKVHR